MKCNRFRVKGKLRKQGGHREKRQIEFQQEECITGGSVYIPVLKEMFIILYALNVCG